jgi:hypothetical protein
MTDEATTYKPLIISAGTVITMFGPDVGALACIGEQVVAVGTRAELAERFPGADVLDLGGEAVVVPGFNDAHIHPSAAAEAGLHLDLSPEEVSSADELEAALTGHAASVGAQGWVRGSRYDHTKTTGGSIIDRAYLDAICPDNPALVEHIAGHWGVANSRALAAAGLDDSSPDPHGGSLGRDAAGRLNGIVYEAAMFQFGSSALADGTPVIPANSLEDRVDSLRNVLREFNAAGLTSLGDALTATDAVHLYQEAQNAGYLTARVGCLISYAHFDRIRDAGIRHGFGDRWLRINGVKAFVDGAVAGGTCLLEESYTGQPDEYGQQVVTEGELLELVKDVHDFGMRLGIHANGDRAISLLLDAYEAAQAQVPRPGLRHRIEHCTVVTDEILRRMRALDAIAVPFGSYVAFHGDKLEPWYGAERLGRMFAHRSFLDAGVTVAGSSDYGCGPFEPLLGMQSCVTRKARDGRVLGGDQRISAREALYLYTVGSAEATGEQHVKGRLAPGYLADFVVLGENPLLVDGDSIAAIPVLETWVGGRRVWARE